MTNSTTKTALITGASGGIGYEIATLFAQDRYNLVLVARSEAKLKNIAQDLTQKFGISVKTLSADLSDRQAPTSIFQQLQSERIIVDVLVNNAGFATNGLLAETDLNQELQMMQLNMMTLTHLIKLLLPGMLARKSGKILNIASTAAFQPGPLMAVYYASKAYVLSLSEALANEVEGTGVSVTVLCPGPTKSGFQTRANMEDSKLFSSSGVMEASTVAKIGYQGLMSHKTIVIPGFRNKLLAFSVRLFPRSIVTKITRSMQEKS
jgi:short-subunit dehydrogenase